MRNIYVCLSEIWYATHTLLPLGVMTGKVHIIIVICQSEHTLFCIVIQGIYLSELASESTVAGEVVMFQFGNFLWRATSEPPQSSVRSAIAADSEVYKMLQEKQEADEPPRQSASFRVLQEILETGTGHQWDPTTGNFVFFNFSLKVFFRQLAYLLCSILQKY